MITNEEKEALFKQVKTEIDSTASSEALEKIKYKYGNFIEIVDLVNDAHIKTTSGNSLLKLSYHNYA